MNQLNTIKIKDTTYYIVELNKTIDMYKNKILYNIDTKKLCLIDSDYTVEIDINNDRYYYLYIIERNIKDGKISYSDKFITSNSKDKNVLNHLLKNYREVLTFEQYTLLSEIIELNKKQEELIKQYDMLVHFTL